MMLGIRKMMRYGKILLGILIILTGFPQFGLSYNDSGYKPVQLVKGNASVAGDDINRTDVETASAFRELRIGLTGKCLDFEGAAAVSGSGAILWDCIDVALQKWSYDESTGLIRNKANPDFCLDNMNQRYDGGNVRLWLCDADNVNQQWELSVSVLSPRNLKSLALTTYGTSNGARVGLSTYLGDEYQQWTWGYAENIPAHDEVATKVESEYSHSTENKSTNVYSTCCINNVYNLRVQENFAQINTLTKH